MRHASFSRLGSCRPAERPSGEHKSGSISEPQGVDRTSQLVSEVARPIGPDTILFAIASAHESTRYSFQLQEGNGSI